ncbi:hypothetical protein BKA81DRAFT_163582 [Phyllosticta paracitricarpa]
MKARQNKSRSLANLNWHKCDENIVGKLGKDMLMDRKESHTHFESLLPTSHFLLPTPYHRLRPDRLVLSVFYYCYSRYILLPFRSNHSSTCFHTLFPSSSVLLPGLVDNQNKRKLPCQGRKNKQQQDEKKNSSHNYRVLNTATIIMKEYHQRKRQSP